MSKPITHEEFTGAPFNTELKITIDDQLTDITYLGLCKAIEYEVQKPALGDKKPEIYRHEFKQKTALLWNGSILIIAGDIQVKKEGII